MRTVRVELASRSYPIYIGTGLLQQLGEQLAALSLGKKILLVTDTQVGLLYGNKVKDLLSGVGFSVTMVQIPAGEPSKTLEQAAKLYDAAFAFGLDRTCAVLALGGGVVGDLAGFVAATYMRGIPFIQVPTTLLAQVDSSVGGKVAVNHPRGKNIIGAFYQPKLVLIDVSTLHTLSAKELRAGLAEVIKYGVIWDAEFFSWLEENSINLLKLEPEALEYAIETCCKIKAAVVEQDETEQGSRAILNYGHTVGHALESLTNYERYLHGEAVAVGMVAAARLALQQGLLSKHDYQRIHSLLDRVDLPTAIPADLKPESITRLMFYDKKVNNGKLTLILPLGIGKAKISLDFPENQLSGLFTNGVS
ncbi:3-dehydroquinate synthase [Desulforamulus aeronauticus]|uniref:3-dehydroquinate synthase n=1 Tax=Desulforamulus aeronauticus DSM 10349 TaxID=1121421 RepID=A0A1M6PI84_9FIRM|nr:3-dehydroquinate synthase [Desulforamulus aeronauticus]SHK07642.1 3-dehydroquinate synthase [Desulforamulus aeronauticus DSM 10349]